MMPLCMVDYQPIQIAPYIHKKYTIIWAFGMPSQGFMMGAPWYHSTSQVGPRFGNSWSLMGGKDAIMSCLRLTSTSDTFPHPYKMYSKFEPSVCCLRAIWVHPYTIPPGKLDPDLGILGCLWMKMMQLCHIWGWHPIQTASDIWAFVMLTLGHMGTPWTYVTITSMTMSEFPFQMRWPTQQTQRTLH